MQTLALKCKSCDAENTIKFIIVNPVAPKFLFYAILSFAA